jgi:UDP-N-acetyl-D-glucosamine dehydrogenase
MMSSQAREIASVRPAPSPHAGAAVGALKAKLANRTAVAGICGMGYVGLPLARAIGNKGLKVIGFDIDDKKIEQLNTAQSYIRHISSDSIADLIKSGNLQGTSDFGRVSEADILVICVPTPLNKYREPDLSYVVSTAENIARNARPGQLIILESTTYPGTTTEILAPILKRAGLDPEKDVFLAFSPEREDPGNPDYSTESIPKVVGGYGAEALDLATTFYSLFLDRVVPVSSTSTAEAVKLTENIFRSVNIALVNELKLIYSQMGIDVWEVIEAAKTKPFGFMPFYPGPGLGGHCIPIDPFYLTWKAREYDVVTRFIELAGEINSSMPQHVVSRLAAELDARFQKGLNGAHILLVGLAYKKNVDDMRESPTLKLMELLEKRGAHVDYYDPFIPEIPATREHPEFTGKRGIAFGRQSLSGYDAALIATDHDSVSYQDLVDHSKLVVDTRNVCARYGVVSPKIAKA